MINCGIVDNFLIENIDEQSFYFGGGIYLHKNITDESLREEQKLKDISSSNLNSFISGSALSDFNLSKLQDDFNSSSSGNASSALRTKMAFEKLKKDEKNPWEYDSDSKVTEINRFMEDFVSTDIVILLNKGPLEGNNLFDRENYSLFVQKLENNMMIGFMVDKFAAYVLYNRSKAYE